MFVFCWYNEATKVDVACLVYPCHVAPIQDSKPLPCQGIHCCKQNNVLKKTNLSFDKEGYLYTITYLLSKFICIHAKIHFQTCKTIC